MSVFSSADGSTASFRAMDETRPDPPPAAVPRQGDGSFDRFVRERRQPLLRFLQRMNVHEHDAQDIAQESLVRLLRYCVSEPAEAWQALLYRIAINLLRDRRRQAGVAVHADAEEAADAASPEPSPERHASSREALARLQAAILRLPPRCREVYLLHRIEGMTYPEIARRHGISTKGVEKHMARALRLMRAELAAASIRNPDDVP
jgi:RNA polymerase sigma-70 factor (ECF subfamily)